MQASELTLRDSLCKVTHGVGLGNLLILQVHMSYHLAVVSSFMPLEAKDLFL